MTVQKNKKIASNIFWRLGERVLAQGVSLIVSIVLARLLLPDEYGIISIVLICIAFADVFASSGFSAALIQKRDARHIDFDTIFYCSLATSAIIYIILFFAAPVIASFFDMPSLTIVLRVFSLRLFIGAYNSVQHAYVSRHLMFKKFFFATLFGTLLSGVIGIAMAFAGLGVWSLVAQYLTNTIIDSIVLSFTIKWHPKIQFSKESAGELWSYGWKVLAANFSGTFFDELRSILIGRFYTPTDLAYYEKGRQFSSTIIDNSNIAVMEVLFPAISNENGHEENVVKLVQKSIKVVSYFVLTLAFALCAIAQPFILLILTDKWSGSIVFMQLLCVASAISLVGNISLQTIKAVGRSDILLKLEFVKKPVYLLFLIIGLNINTIGVAIAAIAYAVYGSFVNASAMGKVIKYPVHMQIKDMLPSVLLGICVGCIMWVFTLLELPYLPTLVLQIVVGATTFFVLSKITKNDSYIIVKKIINSKRRKKHESI